MFDNTTIQNCLENRVGWNNYFDSNVVPNLDPDLNVSESGLFYNNTRSWMDLEVIQNCIPQGQNLSSWLLERERASISELLSRVIVEKKLNESTKSIFANSWLFDGAAPFNQTTPNKERFVGFQIRVKRSIDIEAIIDYFSVQFDSPQTDLTMYLYHTSSEIAVATIDVTTASGKTVHRVKWGESLPYLPEDLDSGGLYYFGYYQADVNGFALRKDVDVSSAPCYSCGKSSATQWKTINQYMEICSVYVPTDDLNGVNMFDYNQAIRSNSDNWGLNLGLSAKCNISEFICTQSYLFDYALTLMMTVNIGRSVLGTKRLNRLEQIQEAMILREIEGDAETNNVGLLKQITDAIVAIDFDMSKLSNDCLPCQYSNGVKFRSV